MLIPRFCLLWLLFFVSLLAACTDTSPPSTSASADYTYRNHSPEATYVGRDVCGTCHADQLASFAASQMGQAFKPATATASIANFDDPAPIYDPERDLYYQPFRQDEALFVKEYRLAGGDTVHQRTERIDYIVGSGQHTNSHMRSVNGYLYQVPVTWYAQDAKWDLAPGFQHGNSSRFSREIEIECMACHNGTPIYNEGSANQYTMLPSGIDCEKCHGPGSIHVEEKRAGIIVNTAEEIDYSIVNPGRLSVDLQYDVCRRCHMQGAAVLKEGKGFLDFRPGMPLAEVMNVFWPRFADSTARFLMASHPDRLEMSACYKASHTPNTGYAPITCTTCHDPHLNIKTVAAETFNAPCQQCHTPEAALVCTEDEAVRARNNNNCSACHMPTSGSLDIPHVRITDHYIRVPERDPELPDDARETFVRLASLIEDNPSERTLAEGFLTYYEQFGASPQLLDSAAVHLRRARDTQSEQALAPSLIRLWFLQGRYREIQRLAGTLDPNTLDDAWTLYRIGESYANLGLGPLSVRYFEAAVAQAPDHLRFKGKLADAYANQQNFDRAMTVYDELLAANPTLDDMLNNRGLLHAAQGNFAEAEADFQDALRLNPDAELAMANLASLYYNTQRVDEAIALTQRLVQLRPDNPQYQAFLAVLQQGATP